MAPHSSTLAWKIPWMKEPGGPQSMGSLRVGHDWATSLSLFTFMHWRRKWQPTPVFLPGESQGRGSLMGCRLWGHTVGHNWSDLAAKRSKPPYPSAGRSMSREMPLSGSRTETGWGSALSRGVADSAGTRGTGRSRGTAAGGCASQPAWSSVTGRQGQGWPPLLAHLKVPSPLMWVLPIYLQSPINNIRAIELMKIKIQFWSD